MIVPLDQLQELTSATGKLTQAYVKLDDPANTDKVIASLKTQLTDYQNKMLFMGEVIWPANYAPNASIFKNGADNAERIITLNDLNNSGVQLTRLYETPGSYSGSELLTRLRGRALSSTR